MRKLQLPSLALSVLLNLLPMVRVAGAQAALAVSPIVAVLRLIAGAAAVAGSYHGVSGATEITSAKSKLGAVDVTLTYRIQSTGSPASFDADPLPPGLTVNNTSGVVSGKPTAPGETVVTVTAWDDANFGGPQISGDVRFRIADVTPLTASVAAGSPVTFSVTGVETLTANYRWLRGDLEIAGATAAQLTLPAVSAADAGSYKVRITPTGSASVTTRAATLTVTVATDPPKFTLTPQNATVHRDESFTLTSAATGAGQLTFAWIKDGQPVANANAASLTVAAASASDAGVYEVNVTGQDGTATSPPATVTVAPPLTLGGLTFDSGVLRLPYDGIVGRTYVLEATPTLSPPVWQLREEAVAGEDPAFTTAVPGGGNLLFRVRTK